MAWDNSVVTNQGVALLKEVLNGSVLKLDYATGGMGTVAATSLMVQTALKEQKQQFTIVSSMNVTNGKKVKIQVSNLGITAGYTLNQIGIWAHVDSGAPVLFAILQDADGIVVPAENEIADFVVSFYAVVNFSNEAEFSVTVDSSAFVSMSTFEEKLSSKADLDENGLVRENQLPDMNYIRTEEKGSVNGVAELDVTGKVPENQLPDMNYDEKGSAQAVQGNLDTHLSDKNNPHAVTLAQIGAAAASHVHAASDITSGTFAVNRGGTGAATFTSNYPLFGNGTSALQALAPLTAMARLGDGYGTCATAAATTAKVVTLANFVRRTGSRVSVYFTYAAPASATMNVNSTGAAAMRCKGAAITSGMIPAGAIADFIFDGSYWQLVGTTNAPMNIVTGSYTGTGTYGSSNSTTITLGFRPKLVFFTTFITNYYHNFGAYISGSTIGPVLHGTSHLAASFTPSDTGITFRGDNAKEALNVSGEVYRYVAIG